MSEQATQATPTDDPGSFAADTRRHRQVLNDLVDMGDGFARLLHGQATQAAQQATASSPQAGACSTPQPADAQPAPSPAPAALASLAAAFDQVARAVRRCILLAQALDKPAQPARDPARERAAARKRILREVEDLIQRPHHDTERDCDGPGAEALRVELHERLDAPDLDDDIASRPVADIIKDIRRDLGLGALPGTRPFQRRTPADVAQLCTRAAAPSAAHRPGPGPGPGPGPHSLGGGDTHSSSDPQPGKPATTLRVQPGAVHAGPVLAGPVYAGSVHAGGILPKNPAGTVAMVLRHPARIKERWPPPSEG